MVTGLSIAREQEQSSLVPAHRASAREQERTEERNMAMNVAVANSLLDQGKAKDAFGLYKEVIKSGTSKSEQIYAATNTAIQERQWTPSELLSGAFSNDQKKKIINNLFLKANAWLNQNQYDRAVETFEQIFLLDPLNVKASRGIDKARHQLIHEKKKEDKVLSKIDKNENNEIIQLELEHAESALENGLRTQAQIHMDRILLIDPENHEAKKLLQRLKEEK